ncbi:MAG TPA: IMP dehydrogenase [Leptospiraceae bacterium]|nr:IMP dehydrogenase [Leptospiraceae bacterium]
MEIRNYESVQYSDVLLKHKKSILTSRSLADISAKLGKHSFRVPLVAANMPSLLTITQCSSFDSSGWFYIYPRTYVPAEVHSFVKYAQDNFNIVSISIGITEEWVSLVKFLKLQNFRVDFFQVDIACAYSDIILPIVDTIKKNYPDSYLIVGNTANAESIPWMESLGIDCARLNVGVSKSCRTREFTGFSCTPLGNLIDCVKEAKTIKLMSDGGLTVEPDGTVWVGDIAKAIRFGADFVMSGAVFAGCVDTPSYSMGYFGNSTEQAKGHKRHVEGTNYSVKKEMTVKQVMQLVEDSLKSSVSYSGGTKLEDIKKVDFIDLRN